MYNYNCYPDKNFRCFLWLAVIAQSLSKPHFMKYHIAISSRIRGW